MQRILVILAAAVVAGLIDSRRRPIRLSFPAPPTQPSEALVAGSSPQAATGELITLEEARAFHEDPGVVFVDASYAHEFEEERIPGSLSLPPESFAAGAMPELLGMISRDATVVVFCRTSECDAALLVALRMREFGFARIRVFEAGVAGWKAAGMPTQKGS